MTGRFGFASLIARGLKVDSVDDGDDTLVVSHAPAAACASGASCGGSGRHAELPAPGLRRTVRLSGLG
jgi:hypothetical protein